MLDKRPTVNVHLNNKGKEKDTNTMQLMKQNKELPQCLSYEIADHTPIINIHTWSISVKDSGNAYFYQKHKRNYQRKDKKY